MDNLGGKAKDTLMKGWGFIKTRAQETAEVSKSMTHVRDLERKHEELMKGLGQRVYTMYCQKHLDVQALNLCCQEIAALEKELDAAHAQAGAASQQLKSHFEGVLPRAGSPCASCGAPLTIVDQRCSRCGSLVGPTD